MSATWGSGGKLVRASLKGESGAAHQHCPQRVRHLLQSEKPWDEMVLKVLSLSAPAPPLGAQVPRQGQGQGLDRGTVPNRVGRTLAGDTHPRAPFPPAHLGHCDWEDFTITTDTMAETTTADCSHPVSLAGPGWSSLSSLMLAG